MKTRIKPGRHNWGNFCENRSTAVNVRTDGRESDYDYKKSSWHACLLVPQGTDVSDLPEGIKVVFMRSFRYEGKDLIWLKRPAGSLGT